LFTVLIQRSNRPVRDLRGRYLYVRLRLLGNQHSSPEIAAVRAYASRFSYRDHYLPELYHETMFRPDADAILPATPSARSTPADFLERFLDNFEGILTPLEERIVDSYLVTDPRTAPTEALDWLGSWIGMTFDPWYPESARRNALRYAPELYRWHGTLEGLKRSLDVATNGGVTGGEIIVLENYRLRRTFATILGADLADEQDPLLAGLSVSGNSYVGDTLFLGDENRKEFLALFSADLKLNPDEEQAVEDLFDRLAHRVTILVHQEVEPHDLALIRRIVDFETPAHVEATILVASYGFMVGIASLVGMDTYLSVKPRPGPVRVNVSQLGVRDLLQRPASLDPRLEAGSMWLPASFTRPIADPGAAKIVPMGSDFELDASGSRAFPGRQITRFIWEIKE
jgi:phage tail-like protein